jgi:hypothetical protein
LGTKTTIEAILTKAPTPTSPAAKVAVERLLKVHTAKGDKGGKLAKEAKAKARARTSFNACQLNCKDTEQ